jgi:putative transcriptional regulator
MTLERHPSDESLLRYAAGSLSVGPSLVVAAHLELCPTCRTQVTKFGRLGGAFLADTAREPMRADALGRALEKLDQTPSTTSPGRLPRSPRRADLGMPLPASLRDCGIGPWRWLGPGFRWSWITVPGSPDARVMLLRGRPGLQLPAHGHTGEEFTLILKGWLFDDRGAYGPGDFDEADDDIDHQPVVGPDVECICLAALDGDTRLHSRLGRWLRPLVGF